MEARNLTIKPLDAKSTLDILNFDMSPLPSERDSIVFMFYRLFRKTCFVGYIGDHLVGFLLGVADQNDPSHVYLHYLVVDKEHRGQHIGDALIKRFMETMKKRGFNRVSLMTSNPKNEHFYARYGFVKDHATLQQANNDVAITYLRDKKKMFFFVNLNQSK